MGKKVTRSLLSCTFAYSQYQVASTILVLETPSWYLLTSEYRLTWRLDKACFRVYRPFHSPLCIVSDCPREPPAFLGTRWTTKPLQKLPISSRKKCLSNVVYENRLYSGSKDDLNVRRSPRNYRLRYILVSRPYGLGRGRTIASGSGRLNESWSAGLRGPKAALLFFLFHRGTTAWSRPVPPTIVPHTIGIKPTYLLSHHNQPRCLTK